MWKKCHRTGSRSPWTTDDGAKDVALTGKEGTHVVVLHRQGNGRFGLNDAGKVTWKVTEGTVTKVRDGGKDVTIQSADGTKKTVHVGKEATVETAHGVVDTNEVHREDRRQVVVYTTAEPTKEVVHLFKKL